MKRRTALVVATALAAWGTASVAGGSGQSERLPLRNLLVELRQGDESRFSGSGASVDSGAVVVGTDGSVSARAGVTIEARSRDAGRDTVQQLRVLNGSQASLRIGADVPVYWLQSFWTANGPGPAVGTQFVATGRSFMVQPRWPGGNAPVTVEVSAESSALSSGGLPRYGNQGQPLPPGSFERAGVVTTLALPLGEWFTVASSGDTATASERGVVSTRDVGSQRRYIVQMRVTAP
jgi:hypothetical protein